MPVGKREIKRRIKSISNTRKITKAMELVAAAKMRKAVSAVHATRPYSEAAWNIVRDLSARTDPQAHPLLQKRCPVRRIGAVLFASNRGLCGGFNQDVVEALASYIQQEKSAYPGAEAEVLLVGKRGTMIMHRYHVPIVAAFDKADSAHRMEDISDAAQMVVSDYLSGRWDRVLLAYTDFRSAVSHRSRVRVLLPIEGEDEELGSVGTGNVGRKTEASKGHEYLFEPSPEIVLNQMLHRIIELQIFQALLESNASEHSARMVAMRNASDAAKDIIDGLTLSFNQARQQAITSELADISSGTAAIR